MSREIIQGKRKNPNMNKGKIGGLHCSSKSVNQFSKNGERVASYASMIEAQQATGILVTSITNSINGRSRTAGGYVWEYKI